MWSASVILILALAACSVSSQRRYIDLTYAFNNETILFPGRRSSFNVEFEGFTAGGFWLASKGFCTSEHTSTHIDAPYHFNQHGRTLDQIPLEDLIDIPGVMIDIYDKVHHYVDGRLSVVENYALTRKDILEWEKVNGLIPPRSVVLLRSGWGFRWPNAVEYKGLKPTVTEPSPTPATTPRPAQESTLELNAVLNYPGFAACAASYLATERNVLGVGIDTLSIDIGSSPNFPAHQIFAARSIYMIENVGNLHLLPPKGFQLWMLPFKIDRGTGAPIRVVASINSDVNKV